MKRLFVWIGYIFTIVRRIRGAVAVADTLEMRMKILEEALGMQAFPVMDTGIMAELKFVTLEQHDKKIERLTEALDQTLKDQTKLWRQIRDLSEVLQIVPKTNSSNQSSVINFIDKVLKSQFEQIEMIKNAIGFYQDVNEESTPKNGRSYSIDTLREQMAEKADSSYFRYMWACLSRDLGYTQSITVDVDDPAENRSSVLNKMGAEIHVLQGKQNAVINDTDLAFKLMGFHPTEWRLKADHIGFPETLLGRVKSLSDNVDEQGRRIDKIIYTETHNQETGESIQESIQTLDLTVGELHDECQKQINDLLTRVNLHMERMNANDDAVQIRNQSIADMQKEIGHLMEKASEFQDAADFVEQFKDRLFQKWFDKKLDDMEPTGSGS